MKKKTTPQTKKRLIIHCMLIKLIHIFCVIGWVGIEKKSIALDTWFLSILHSHQYKFFLNVGWLIRNDFFFFCCVWVFVCVCVFQKNILSFFLRGGGGNFQSWSSIAPVLLVSFALISILHMHIFLFHHLMFAWVYTFCAINYGRCANRCKLRAREI